MAAPTCSLPEAIGGVRNWDYRYTWIRDAAFTLYAPHAHRLHRGGGPRSWTGWTTAGRSRRPATARCRSCTASTAGPTLTEEILDHLGGLPGLAAGADRQRRVQPAPTRHLRRADGRRLPLQQVRQPISYDVWAHLGGWSDWVCDNWRREDEGIWEVRGGRQHFVYSKLMCWVAIDRGLRLADKRSLPRRPGALAGGARRDLRGDHGPGAGTRSRQAFVQRYGSDVLDASNLLMPLVFFISPTDPRMLSTLDAISRPPGEGGLVSDGLVYRYDPERPPTASPGDEGTFNICTFWLVEALTRAGRTDRHAGGGAADVRADARLRQPPRPVRGADRQHAARRWGTFPRRSPTSRSSAPPSTSTGRWALAARERTHMKAIAIYPGKANSVHLREIPMPRLEEVPNGRGVLVKMLACGVDGTDKEINAAEYGAAPRRLRLSGHRPRELRPRGGGRPERHRVRARRLRRGHHPPARRTASTTRSATTT